jgi:hypothetical protein
MKPDKLQKVCDAFNLLLSLNKIQKDACYQIIDDKTRAKFEKEMFVLGYDIPSGYSRSKDYVLIWVPLDTKNPFKNSELVEVGDLIAEAEKDKVGKGILQ